ncbi:hypothetical protein [Streptomyces sp. NPDC050164]|uniref:hypothetical protein n=1 Tax=Streptomyces sp. NPDC050164 TaxID=3365605 RepID=UPI0037AE39EE
MCWLAVALISVVGTLISDNLTDNMGVLLETSTTVFAIVLAVVSVARYRSEHTLSIHSVDTTRRESFYWLAVLFAFALATSAGDLVERGKAPGCRSGSGSLPAVANWAPSLSSWPSGFRRPGSSGTNCGSRSGC